MCYSHFQLGPKLLVKPPLHLSVFLVVSDFVSTNNAHLQNCFMSSLPACTDVLTFFELKNIYILMHFHK